MKLVDKIKNYFCDEDEEDVPKKNTPLKVEQPTVKVKLDNKVEKKDAYNQNDTNLDAISERELFKSDPTFNFPIIFDDEDFKDEELASPRITVAKKEQTKIVERIEPKIFKPSPNISPIYGIIDNDAKKENVSSSSSSDNLLNLYDENKKIDIDDILGKVYDQKRVEINRDNYTEIKDDYKGNTKDNSSFDLFNNIEADKKGEIITKIDITKNEINNVDEKLKTIDELLENTDEDDFYSLVDSMYKENNEEGDNWWVNSTYLYRYFYIF